jgi:hypothetical protein
MTLGLALAAAATARGELAAFIDTFDRLDVASTVSAGVDLARFLWVRGQASGRAPEAATVERALDRALKALNLVLQAGGFGVVTIDLADVPLRALGRLPFMTWTRVQRAIEGSDTVCVLLAPEPLARSAGGLTLSLSGRPAWAGDSDRSRRLDGLDIATRAISPRRHVSGTIEVMARSRGW